MEWVCDAHDPLPLGSTLGLCPPLLGIRVNLASVLPLFSAIVEPTKYS